jgi:hypothetical protein
MNVRLKKTFNWSSAIVHDSKFLINHYNVDLDMITVSDNNEEQNIAYERIKTFFHDVMEDAVLISRHSPVLEAYQSIDARVIAFPADPFDQVVGMMLYLKLNSIMENRIVITDVSISSAAGDSMRYLHSSGEALGPLDCQGWWTDSRPCWYDPQEKSSGKVVNLSRVPEWKEYSLDWANEQSVENSVVFAKFRQDEDQ